LGFNAIVYQEDRIHLMRVIINNCFLGTLMVIYALFYRASLFGDLTFFAGALSLKYLG
jgi:hypothetical protein